MANPSRCITYDGGTMTVFLHPSGVDDFAQWARGEGYDRLDTKGGYEALRLSGGNGLLIFHKSQRWAHLTIPRGRGVELVTKWISQKLASSQIGKCPFHAYDAAEDDDPCVITDGRPESNRVECPSCGAEGPWSDSREEAILKWNAASPFGGIKP